MMGSASSRRVLLFGLVLGILSARIKAEPGQPVPQQGASVAAAELEGIGWQLVELGGKPVSLAVRGNQHNLLLDPSQKRASGFSGCNTFTAGYSLAGTSLKFGPVAATRRACPEAVAVVETEFLKVLERTRNWMIKDGNLLLMSASEVLARFTGEKEGVLVADLESITVRSTVIPSGSVTLIRGEYRKDAAPGSASQISVRLSDKRASGTLRGTQICAVVLISSAGGTGTFSELALLARRSGKWVNPDTVLLGDRVQVRSVAIRGDTVVVSMATHGPQDPMCCPTLEATKQFPVQGDRLLQTKSATASGESQITTGVWVWQQTLMNDGKKTVPPKPENYTLRFLPDGKIEVRADCNRKGGTYTVQDKKLSIAVTISTMAACEAGSLEDQFVRDLSAAAGFFLKDGGLFLDLKYDSGTMRFTKHP